MRNIRAFAKEFYLIIFLTAVLLCETAFLLPRIWNKAIKQDVNKQIATNLR